MNAFHGRGGPLGFVCCVWHAASGAQWRARAMWQRRRGGALWNTIEQSGKNAPCPASHPFELAGGGALGSRSRTRPRETAYLNSWGECVGPVSMFGRESGGEDAEPAFGWPSGFRERRTNLAASGGAEPDTSAPSTSSPLFRQKPHLAAHRKSSDQVIQQLRDELDRQRQMFFDRLAPQWDQRVSVRLASVRRARCEAAARPEPPLGPYRCDTSRRRPAPG